jgi:hypothetical protein
MQHSGYIRENGKMHGNLMAIGQVRMVVKQSGLRLTLALREVFRGYTSSH